MIDFIKRLFRTPSAHEMLVQQLEEAKREKTLVSMERERFTHAEKMLRDRIVRIEAELASKEIAE